MMLVLGAALAGLARGEQSSEADSTVSSSGTMTMRYEVLQTDEPDASSVDAAGDTLTFTLYYVDTDCTDYGYQLEHSEDRIVVRRVPGLR